MRIKLNIEIDADLPRDSADLAQIFMGFAGLDMTGGSENQDAGIDSYLDPDDFSKIVNTDFADLETAVFADLEADMTAGEMEAEHERLRSAADAVAAIMDKPQTGREEPAVITGEIVDEKTDVALKMIADAGFKPTQTASLVNGERVKAGDTVKIKGEDFEVLATARGRVAVLSEEGVVTLVPVDALDHDAPEQPKQPESDETMTRTYTAEEIAAAKAEAAAPTTLADLRILGKKVQDHIGVDAVMEAIRVVNPAAVRISDVPESSYGAVAEQFRAKLAAVGKAA